MIFEDKKVYHIYNRGNNQQQIFFDDSHYKLFLEKIEKELLGHCDILKYCLMPNHFHLMANVRNAKINDSTGKEKTLNDKIGIVLRSYTRMLQLQRNFTGSLFQQKTKAKELNGNDDWTNKNYITICGQYIEQNPLKAGIVKNLDDWPYSSHLDYIGKRDGNLCNQKLFFELCQQQESNLFANYERFLKS